MKKNLLLSLVLLVLCSISVGAQSLSVESFRPLEFDLTALQSATEKKDFNGETAALIKVVNSNTGFSFEGGLMGIVATQQRVGEIWVYVPRGIKKITILHQTLGVLRDYFFPCAIEAARTYELKLTSGQVVTTVIQDLGGQYLTMQVTPPNAVVYVDDILQSVNSDGTLSLFLPRGSHTYRVEASSHVNSAGAFEIGDKKERLNVALKSALATLTVTVDDQLAEVYVNEQKKGVGNWTGNLVAGMYAIEARRNGFRTVRQSVELSIQEQKTVSLTGITPIYGMLQVASNPIDANVYIDGKLIGTSPDIFKSIFAGTHELKVSKSGFKDFIKPIEIAEHSTHQEQITLEKGGGERTFTVKGVTFKMIGIQGGTFTMGATSEQGSDAGGDEEPAHQVTLSDYAIGETEVTQQLFKMIGIQGGTFTMGATSEQGSDAEDREKPAHQVTLSDYAIGETEVTQQLWEAVMGKNPSYNKDTTNPVERVNWNDCQKFIKKLNSLTGAVFALPTEAQWEYAARGGSKSQGYKYSGSNNLSDVAWYKDNSGSATHPVATKQANELGLYDMSGNVWEWCSDWYGSYSGVSQTNPTGANSGSYRVSRGGSWIGSSGCCRVSYRGYGNPNDRHIGCGLRLVLVQE